MAVKKNLKASTAAVVNEGKDDMLDQIQAAVDLLMMEARKSKIAAEKNRALEARKLLEAAIDVKTIRNRTAPLTSDEALQLLNALDLSNKSVVSVEQGNRGKGYDGKTFTERRMEAQKDLATKEQIIATLKEIKEHRDDVQNEREDKARGLKEVFTDGLKGFLGPAGPLVEMWSDLKKEHGEDAKRLRDKFSSVLGLQRTLHQEFELEGRRSINRQEKLFDMLGNQFKKLKDAVGSGGSGNKGMFEKLFDHLGGGGKGGRLGRGGGKGGMLTKAKRFMRRMPGIGKLMRPGGFGKLGGFLRGAAGTAGKALGGAGRMLGRFVPGLGAVIGAYGLATTDGAQASDTGVDKALAYGEGALNGAAIGMIGGPVGAAIGAVVGVAITGIVRNWSGIKRSLSDGWNGFQSLLGKTWDATKEFFADGAYYTEKLWRGTKKVASDTYDWLKEHIPGFGSAVTAIGSAATSVSNFAKTASLGGGAGSDAFTPGPAAAASFAASNPSRNSGAMAQFTGKLNQPSEEVRNSIFKASDATGVDKGLMMGLINAESSFNPNAGAGTSSAKGLGQFTDGKWSDMVRKYGKQYGIGEGDRMDKDKNAMMTALLIRDNKAALEKEGLDSGGAGIYALHFMGDSGGKKFLRALNDTPNADATSMFPAAAKANYNVFYNKDGTPKTLREVYQYMQQKVEQPAEAYSASLAPKVDEQPRVASETPGSNVNVAAAAPQAAQQSGAGAGRGGQGGPAIGEIPTVLGDNNMVVVNAGMFG